MAVPHRANFGIPVITKRAALGVDRVKKLTWVEL